MPSRRTVLGAISASLSGVVAGCVGNTGGEPDETSETGDPSKPSEPSATTGPSPSKPGSPGGTTTPYYEGECVAVEHDWVNPTRESVEPKSLPEGPPSFDADAVADFVVAYEEAYLYNSVLREDTSKVGTWAQTPEVSRVAGGFVLSLRSSYYHNLRDVTTGNGTATEVHADGPESMKAYLLTRDRLVRAEGKYDVTPDPRKTGTTVECWSGE